MLTGKDKLSKGIIVFVVGGYFNAREWRVCLVEHTEKIVCKAQLEAQHTQHKYLQGLRNVYIEYVKGHLYYVLQLLVFGRINIATGVKHLVIVSVLS